MREILKSWVEGLLAAYSITYFNGAWEEAATYPAGWICAIIGLGGGTPDVEDRSPRFRVILLGSKNGRSEVQAVGEAAELLMQGVLDETTPCGVTRILALGEPIGPGFTTEDRPYYSLDFEILY